MGRGAVLRPCAFSLIELLAVVSIIAVVVVVLLPVLGRTRDAARASKCQMNLRGMITAWEAGMAENGGVIPRTEPGLGQSWANLLDRLIPNAPSLSDAAIFGRRVDSFNHCPQLHEERVLVLYVFAKTWGYAINRVWDSGIPLTSLQFVSTTGRRWSEVRRPSHYPWFADPDVTFSTPHWNATTSMPRERSATLWRTWGLGPWHGGGQVANVAFADGSCRPIGATEVTSQTVGDGSYAWFDND